MIEFKNKRQMVIYNTLIALGGTATIREIADKAGLNVNGVPQTIGVMPQIHEIEYRNPGGNSIVRIIK